MQYLTPNELVARYKGKFSKRTLANWRSNGNGPPFLKLGGRVLYEISKLEEWESRRMEGLKR